MKERDTMDTRLLNHFLDYAVTLIGLNEFFHRLD